MKSTVLTAAALLAPAFVTDATLAQAVQWRVEDGGNGHWYQLDTTLRSWTNANNSAESRGGHLVTVTSYAEHVFLKGHVFTYCCSMCDTWMGASRSSVTENYHWVTGEPFVPLPELAFNNNSAGWDAPALYLEQVIRYSWIGEWGGESNSANIGTCSVIEWDADCNNDGIVDYGQIRAGLIPDENGNNIPDTCECAQHPELGACCTGDIVRDSRIDGADLAAVLSHWGVVTSNAVSIACDLDHSGTVDGNDLGILLAHWGPCAP